MKFVVLVATLVGLTACVTPEKRPLIPEAVNWVYSELGFCVDRFGLNLGGMSVDTAGALLAERDKYNRQIDEHTSGFIGSATISMDLTGLRCDTLQRRLDRIRAEQ